MQRIQQHLGNALCQSQLTPPIWTKLPHKEHTAAVNSPFTVNLHTQHYLMNITLQLLYAYFAREKRTRAARWKLRPELWCVRHQISWSKLIHLNMPRTLSVLLTLSPRIWTNSRILVFTCKKRSWIILSWLMVIWKFLHKNFCIQTHSPVILLTVKHVVPVFT